MGYNDKYPDMSAMYAVQFEYENRLKDKIEKLETELDRTHKQLKSYEEFITKLYLNGNITDEQLERHKKKLIKQMGEEK